MKNTTIGSVLLAATFASGCTFLFGTDDFLGEDAGQQQTDSGSQSDAGKRDSAVSDGAARDSGSDSGICEHDGVPGCMFDSSCVLAGTHAPDNDCQFCDPEANRTGWTPSPSGAACSLRGATGYCDESSDLPTCCAGWTEVATGGGHTCAIRTDGSIWCWGANEFGQLGVGDTGPRPVPTRVGVGTDWAHVTAGDDHSCGIKRDGSLWCWGRNNFGQLGLAVGDTLTRHAPARLGDGTSWVEVVAGGSHACARRVDGSIWCWGLNGDGQLGIAEGDTTNRPVPTQVGSATVWAKLSAGTASTCGIRTDQSVWCWGWNETGSIDSSLNGVLTVPFRVGTNRWGVIAPGYTDSCGIQIDGTLWCWGLNEFGQVGVGDELPHEPVKVGAGTSWTDVEANAYNACARRSDGSIWCWGWNQHGHLGLGDTMARSVPTQMGTATTWTHLALGRTHACGLRANGTLHCWGSNAHGQLGVGDDVSHHAPVQLPCP